MKKRMECFLTLALLAGFSQGAGAAVNFTVAPSSVSNTYNGAITLQVTGLAGGDTVVVQKFLDVNSNGVVDAGDLLFQQFTLTDGQATVFLHGATSVTNFNVPGDTDSTAGQIAALLYQSADFSQRIVGNYLFVVSSSAGHFSPLTNSFAVTNYPFAQKFTGIVASNGVAVPYAAVLLFQPVGDGQNPQSGAVANNLGRYTISVPAGTYTLAAFKTNFVGNITAASSLVLGSGQTITTNLSLIAATESISGKAVDTNTTSIGLPGVLVPVQTKTGLLAIGFTDTNGNFSVGVTTNQWKVQVSDQSVDFHGYLRLESDSDPMVDTTGGSVSGITFALPKATAIFYGAVTDNLGHPVGGIDIFSGENTNNSPVGQDSDTLTNGNYVAGALAGQSWGAGPSSDANATNYVYPQGSNATLTAGQAFLQNFTVLATTGQITGYVKFTNNPVVGVQVNANATNNGTNFQVQADTDTNGNYVLSVANGAWSVAVSCNGGSDSLDGILGNGSYQCPNNQYVTNSNNGGVANFNVQLPTSGNDQIFGSVTDADGDPIIGVNVYANDGNGHTNSTATDSGGYYSFSLGDGNWDISVDCGGLSGLGYACVSDQDTDICCGESIEIDFIASANQPLQITTTSLPRGTNGTFYSQALQAIGGQSPYTWTIPGFSASPPPNLNLSTNGDLFGTPSTGVGVHYFDVIVTDSASNTAELDALPLTIVNADASPLQIPGVSLPLATVGTAYSAQLTAAGGQTPYTWSLALGSASLPSGLSLNTNGLISGTPTTNKTTSFKVQVTDASFITTNRVLSITVSAGAQPVLSSPMWSANRFQARLTGTPGQNYTLQLSTNLHSTNWISLYVTNNPTTNSFIITDSNATNKGRFYRVLVGP